MRKNSGTVQVNLPRMEMPGGGGRLRASHAAEAVGQGARGSFPAATARWCQMDRGTPITATTTMSPAVHSHRPGSDLERLPKRTSADIRIPAIDVSATIMLGDLVERSFIGQDVQSHQKYHDLPRDKVIN